MEAQIPSGDVVIQSVAERRGVSYPTRSDTIAHTQDRKDWIEVARRIMTKGGNKPDAIQKIADAGSARIEVIKSFQPRGQQRSLWNILLGIINSMKQEKIVMPTVPEMTQLFEELNPPKLSPALEEFRLSHPSTETVSIPRKTMIELPVVSHTSRRVGGVLTADATQGAPEAAYFLYLTAKQQQVFLLFYGYKGEGDPSHPASYNGHRKSIVQVATDLGVGYQTIYARFGKIAETIRTLREVESEEPEEENSEEVVKVVTMSQEATAALLDLPKRNNLQVFPDMTHINELSFQIKADMLTFYGYKGIPHDMTLPESYDVRLRKTVAEVAEGRGAKPASVHVNLSIGYKTLQKARITSQSVLDISEEALPREPKVSPNMILPSFLQKRRTPTSIPKRTTEAPRDYSGQTTPDIMLGRGVIRGPQPIPQQFIPPSSNTWKKSVAHSGERKDIIQPSKPHKPSEDISFERLVADASEGKIIGKKPEPKPEPVPEKKPRQMPKFTAYTEALVWLQRQEDWMEAIAQRTKNDPILKDDLSLRTWLIVRNLQEVIPVLQNMKELYGTRTSFNALMNKALEPIPEQKMSIVDIQKNAAWKALIEGVFQQHESANYDGFMESIGLIFSDEALSAGIFDLMSEYEAVDYMDILALIAEKNWTKEDAKHYENRTLKDSIAYKPGKYTGLDNLLSSRAHIRGKTLITELQNITLKAPIGEERWLRYSEYSSPEVSLYDIVVALVQKNGGDIHSSKTLFHKFEEIIR